jgi:predicted CopG family antitoxin
MTQQERLDKFKTLYKPKEGYTMLLSIYNESFNAWLFIKIEIVNKKGNKDIAERYIGLVKDKDIQEFIKQLDKYIEKKSI